MNVAELLIELGIASPAQAPYSAIIELYEHQLCERIVHAPFKDGLVDRIFSSFDNASKQGLVELDIGLAKTGGARLTLSTANIVGHSVVSDGTDKIFLIVRPKVPAARVLDLALAAENLPSWKSELTTGTSTDASTVEWTISAFACAVQSLVSTGGVRSSHERRKEELRARVRGRLLTVPFIRNVALGKPDRVPCEFGALHVDSVANRIIRWSLHVCILIARELPQSEPTLSKLRHLDLAFSGVSLTPPTPQDLSRQVALPAGLKHYKTALSWSQVILRRFYLDARIGSYSSPSVCLDMNKLYEGAFYNLMRKLAPTAERQVRWPVGFSTEEKVARNAVYKPDIFIPASSGKMATVLDTKWKKPKANFSGDAGEAFELVDQSMQLVPINTADLYQLTSYAIEVMAQGTNKCLAMLVYPTLGKATTWTRRLMIGPNTVSIHLVGWDVAAPPRESVEIVWKYVEDNREISVEGPP